MDLKDYLSQRGKQAELANKTGLAPAYIWQIANGLRPVPVGHCAAFEKACDGDVTRKDLRPTDWHLIWPELADKEQSEAKA